MLKNRVIGSSLLITGTSIGAGILALPLVSAKAGFPFAVLALLALWALTLYGALLILEVNLNFDVGASFSTLGRYTLGRNGQLFINLCMASLFYCLTAAYIAGGSQFLTSGIQQYVGIHFPLWVSALLFTVFLGGLVTWHTVAVDLTNRILMVLKMVTFFAVIFLLLPHVNGTLLHEQPHRQGFLWFAIPVLFTAFGFHGSIPSIVKYVGQHPKSLRRVFFIGSTIPLLLYLCWEAVTLGILPLQGSISFASIGGQNASVANFINTLGTKIDNTWIYGGIHFFTNIAVTTSFLGVTLGLFDFFADLMRQSEKISGRLLTAVITFVPPLLFAIFYPNGFVKALGYAAIPLAFLAIILPAVMAYRTRALPNKNTHYQVRGGTVGLFIAFILGLSIIGMQLIL